MSTCWKTTATYTIAVYIHVQPIYLTQQMRKLATLALFCALSLTLLGQEKSPDRITTYTVELNALKHQEQVTGIESAVAKIPYVTSCRLNWTDYQLVFVVEEGNERGNFPMERLKAIIDQNQAQLVNFRKEIKK